MVFGLVALVAAPSAAQRTRERSVRPAIEKETTKQPTQQQTLYESQAQADLVLPKGLDAPIDPDTYVIGPSDQFVLALRGQVQQKFMLEVLPEGTILLPNFGAFPVAGMTITELREKLAAAMRRYYKNVEFELQLVVPRTFVVYVLGQVEKPGAVQLSAPFRLATAIEIAGGVKNVGSRRYIEVLEEGKVVHLVDLFSFAKLGRVENNPMLKEGQTVYVPTRQAAATIFGNVWNAGTYEVRDGETMADMIRFAGGAKSYSDQENIILERYDEIGRANVERYAISEVDTVLIHDRDIVVVPDARLMHGDSYVQVKGGGGRTGKVYIEEGETISAFIPRFYNLTENHDITRAVIERELEDGSVEHISVDFEKLIAGDSGEDILLRDGDIIAIPVADDRVYVSGEVVDPGEVPYQRGLPAERYIAIAGGPTRNGSMNKLTIFSKDGSSRKGDRESQVVRGDTILLERTWTSYVGPIFVAFTSLTSLILSVIAVSR